MMARTRHAGWLAPAIVAGLLAIAARAQDRRVVTEPRLAPVCAALPAALRSQGGDLPATAEGRPDTPRIQQALDHCPSGQAVLLRPSRGDDAFLSGPLRLPPGVALRIARGATLFASRNPRDYDTAPGRCGTVDRRGGGCRPLILARDAPHAGVMGAGTIDGRGGDPLLGGSASWWDLAQQAKRTNKRQNVPRLIVATHSDDFILYRITLRDSPNFHAIVGPSRGFTAWGVRVDAPATARNTDGIDLSSCTDASILYCVIRDGDDDVAIKAGAAGPSAHVTVAHDHFYSGHGMSIGSETQGGVFAVRVRDLTIDGAVNGLRIKSDASRGGLVRDISYRDICLRNVKYPLLITPFYSRQPGSLIPDYRDIRLRGVVATTPGRVVLLGHDAAHPLELTLDGVAIPAVGSRVSAADARLRLGPGAVSFVPRGPDVTLSRLAGDAPPLPLCAGRFVPYSAAAADPPARRALVVATDGSGDFRSVQQAVDALPATGGTIRLRPGVYRETLVVAKPHVRLIGARDPRQVTIVYGNSAGTSGGTLHSATVTVTGDDFFARGLTFSNDYSAHRPLRPEGSQAVALLVTGDRAVFRDVRILGAQDTLYAGARSCASEHGPCVPARQFFSHCFIAGNVDFIFGDGTTYFQDCEIRALPHSEAMLTAQSKRYSAERSGYVFAHCTVTAAPGAHRIYLGRPWRPYATVVFLDADLRAAIAPAGWREWHPGQTDSLATAFYAEYHSTGPGAAPAAREPYSHQLTAAQTRRYTRRAWLSGPDGWDPTRVR